MNRNIPEMVEIKKEREAEPESSKRTLDLKYANAYMDKLACVAVRHGLYKYVRHRNNDLSDKAGELVIAVQEEDDMLVQGGQMKAPMFFANIVESIFGAVYVDCGFDLELAWVVSDC
ncbi:hypothetical protein L1887_34477 [Cichorium endivia]|nr:hypothetical protein L1887_34477 [Cichorium endivia]